MCRFFVLIFLLISSFLRRVFLNSFPFKYHPFIFVCGAYENLTPDEVWKLSLFTEVCRKSNETLSIMDRNGRVCCSPNGVSLAVRQAGPGYL